MKQDRAAAGREMVIAVAGCVAQAEGEEIVRRCPRRRPCLRSPDLSSPPAASGGARSHRPGSRRNRVPGRRQVRHARLHGPSDMASPPSHRAGRLRQVLCHSAWFPIRAAPNSRVRCGRGLEAQKLAARGVREITLLGQNVQCLSWRRQIRAGEPGGLVAELSRIPGIERLRYTTSHPRT